MEWLNGKEKITEFMVKYKYVLLVLSIGIFIMMIPEKQAEPITQQAEHQAADIPSLQESLETTLSKIKGAGKVEVLLTEYSGEEVEYQLDESASGPSDSKTIKQETVILSNSSRDEIGLIRRVISPVYQGALVVCQGADSAVVRLSIIEAVSKLTGLSSNQISVLKMK